MDTRYKLSKYHTFSANFDFHLQERVYSYSAACLKELKALVLVHHHIIKTAPQITKARCGLASFETPENCI